jgi:integrase
MSIYKRKSGRWAVLVDSDRSAFRLFFELPINIKGRRRTETVATFYGRDEAEKHRARLIQDGDSRVLSIEEAARGRRTLGTFSSHKAAAAVERDWLSAKARGVDLSPTTVSIKVLVDRYVGDRTALGRGKKTVEEYQRIADLYISPHLGSVLVSDLRPVRISGWVGMLLSSGGRGGKPIAGKTARHAFALLNAALRWGVKMEVVGRNACEAANRPKAARSTAKALSISEIGALSSMARGTRWETFIAIALMLGARRGEVLALTWNDVDLDAGRVIIRASLSQTKGAIALKTTKTDRVRTVPISASTVAAFRKQHAQQAADKLLIGEAYRVDLTLPIFTDELGGRLSPKAAPNAFARLAKKAGSSTTSLHSTRHTAATTLVRAGIDLRTVSSILGHSNASVTLGIYSHVVEGAERAAVDVLEVRLEPAMTSRVEG